MANTTTKSALECGFCYTSEQGNHGEIKREWSDEFTQHIPVCRRHSLNDNERTNRILLEDRRERRKWRARVQV